MIGRINRITVPGILDQHTGKCSPFTDRVLPPLGVIEGAELCPLRETEPNIPPSRGVSVKNHTPGPLAFSIETRIVYRRSESS
jgi:hypothetical protein